MDVSHDERVTEFVEVLGMVRAGSNRAWLAVNIAMIETYEEIGALLSRKIQDDGWGQSDVEGLAKWLAANFGEGIGFTARNLMAMKSFHEIWSEAGRVPRRLLELPWACHLVLLEHCAIHKERLAFLEEALQGAWSAEELAARIQAGSPKRLHARPIK